MKIIAIVLGIVGGMIGVVSAISALVTVGANSAYIDRLWAGWLAILLAVVASVAALFLSSRPAAASLTMLIAGVAGFVCLNLFDINTFYGLYIPLLIIAAVLVCVDSRTSTS